METFNYTTQTRTLLADLYTPVGIYMRLRDLYPQSALMESSDYHEKDNSRSFIGIHPIASFAVSHGEAVFAFPDGTEKRTAMKDIPLYMVMNEFLSYFCIEGKGKGYCGLYGYTSFNAVRYLEGINVKDETLDRNDAPDILYIMYRDIIVFDHFNNKLTLITLNQD